MTRTRSRHRATARSRFSESSQTPPSAASDSVISTTALTATRPARRRSRTASPIRNPSTPSALVFYDPSAPERDRPSPEHPREIGSVRGQHDCRAARPDVPEHVEDLGHLTLPEPPEIVAEHLNVAFGGEIVAIEEPQQRRLARARWSGQDDELTLGDPEADIAQRRDLHRPDRVHLPDANNLNHGGHIRL